jgi:hypothetical protein
MSYRPTCRCSGGLEKRYIFCHRRYFIYLFDSPEVVLHLVENGGRKKKIPGSSLHSRYSVIQILTWEFSRYHEETGRIPSRKGLPVPDEMAADSLKAYGERIGSPLASVV